MLPIPDKSWVIGEYLENWYDIKDGEAYVVLTQEEGLVFKVVTNLLKKKKTILLKSLNTIYETYELHVGEIREVWKFCNYISNELPDNTFAKDELLSKIMRLEHEVKGIREAIS